jgi:hypothetical protein
MIVTSSIVCFERADFSMCSIFIASSGEILFLIARAVAFAAPPARASKKYYDN